jgi:hypothetical protein
MFECCTISWMVMARAEQDGNLKRHTRQHQWQGADRYRAADAVDAGPDH